MPNSMSVRGFSTAPCYLLTTCSNRSTTSQRLLLLVTATRLLAATRAAPRRRLRRQRATHDSSAAARRRGTPSRCEIYVRELPDLSYGSMTREGASHRYLRSYTGTAQAGVSISTRMNPCQVLVRDSCIFIHRAMSCRFRDSTARQDDRYETWFVNGSRVREAYGEKGWDNDGGMQWYRATREKGAETTEENMTEGGTRTSSR